MSGMPEPLEQGLARVRALLLDPAMLVRAVGTAGSRPVRGTEPSAGERVDRVELRVVDLKSGPHVQCVWRTGPRVDTRNVAFGDTAGWADLVDELVALPLRTWHVETESRTVQLRVTKRGQAQVHEAATSRRGVASRSHDRVKARLIDTDDPLYDVLGAGADADKRRQVDAFLRLMAPVVDKAFPAGRPLRVVDLGCGNAYLTMAAHRYLCAQRPGTVTVGVELRGDLVDRSAVRADQAGLDGLTFVSGTIAAADPGLDGVDVVLALHACDTATDEALARAVRWQAPVVLAAPCCHHDIQRQLATSPATAGPAGSARPPEPPGPPELSGPPGPPRPPGPPEYRSITTHPILRERFADVLTDALRSAVLRRHGYRVDVVEFVDSRHTPRNAMIRARHTGASPDPGQVAADDALAASWGVVPALARMLDPTLEATS